MLRVFEDASASIPIRQLERAFEGAGIRRGEDSGEGGGARRTEFRRYVAGVDQRDPRQRDRLGVALGALIAEVAESKQEFLVTAAERDGFLFADGVFRPSGAGPRTLTHFPAAVPEIPVTNVDAAAAYYVGVLGFRFNWGDDEVGIGGITQGDCRMFLTNPEFRKPGGTRGPVIVWLNLNSKDEVDELYRCWKAAGAKILAAPEDKPWHLREFRVADPDGNQLRVFYDFSWELDRKDAGGTHARTGVSRTGSVEKFRRSARTASRRR
jgi:uncharacterized glyoxalase superfamily protein PhnB